MFKGKVVIITGSSTGLGAGAAIKFARENAKGIVLHGRNEKGLQDVKEKCEKTNRQTKIHICVGDITDEAVRKNIIDSTIKEFGQLDILINNAGIAGGGGLCDTDMDKYDEIFNINLRSVMALTQLAIPHLIKTKGNVVNISSESGLKASSALMFYGCSKAALDHFTKCLAIELGPKGVRVNSVNPAYVPGTEIVARQLVPDTEGLLKFIENRAMTCPLRRCGKIEEMADAIAFLSSDNAAFITGTILAVDGGSTSV